jgi:hypothetical protein
MPGNKLSGPQLPTFLIIGAQKCGTTWLHHQLSKHPDVFMSKEKELLFFMADDKPVNWYQEQFAGARPDQQRGEASPEYMIGHGVAERIHRLLPNVRLITLVRDPAARAFSQWPMSRALESIPLEMSLIEAFRKNQAHMRTRGEYVDQIERFAEFFPPHQIGTFVYDDLVKDVRAFWRSILVFLGVDADFEPPGLGDRIDAGEYGSLRMSADERAEMVAYYEPFTARLEQRLGRRLPDWRKVETVKS